MYELRVQVTKVVGECTGEPPSQPGDYFTVRDGDIRIPQGGSVCPWALQSLLPLITPKEREISEEDDEDSMRRVRYAQCPDPEGRVIFRIERVGKVKKDAEGAKDIEGHKSTEVVPHVESVPGELRDLRVVVDEVKGKCTSKMRAGDHFTFSDDRLYIPADGHFCLYALQTALLFLPAKQRALEDGDWLKEDSYVTCPDPAGNVILRIE